MSKLKPLAVLAAAGLVAVAVSGCWAMSGYTLSKTKLAPGPAKKSLSKIQVSSHVTEPATEYFFIFTAVGDESGLTFGNSGRFDIKKKFGNRPKPLVGNSTILNEILDDGNCGPFELSDYEDPIGEGEYKVLATPNEFNNRGVTNKQAISKIKLRQDALSTIGNNGAQDILPDTVSDVLIAVGGWEDVDNDGVVDAADGFGCAGGTVTELTTKFED